MHGCAFDENQKISRAFIKCKVATISDADDEGDSGGIALEGSGRLSSNEMLSTIIPELFSSPDERCDCIAECLG